MNHKQGIWVDYTRRNDPALKYWADKLKDQLQKSQSPPDVFCFWTKAPSVVAELYKDSIEWMQDNGTIVISHVTFNSYGTTLEPGVPDFDITGLVRLLGSRSIRMRFDPVIPGFTTKAHFLKCLDVATDHHIKRITINWLSEYSKSVEGLKAAGITIAPRTLSQKCEALALFRDLASERQIEIAVCAESADFASYVPGVRRAACSDLHWVTTLSPSLIGMFDGHPTRKGCGCVKVQDWGDYVASGAPACPHACVYCYAR